MDTNQLFRRGLQSRPFFIQSAVCLCSSSHYHSIIRSSEPAFELVVWTTKSFSQAVQAPPLFWKAWLTAWLITSNYWSHSLVLSLCNSWISCDVATTRTKIEFCMGDLNSRLVHTLRYAPQFECAGTQKENVHSSFSLRACLFAL